MAQAPAIEQVIAAVVERMEGLVPSLRSQDRFKRSGEAVAVAELPARAAHRLFNLDALDGQDDSQEGKGVLSQGAADRRVRLRLEVAYAKGRAERELEVLVPSDAEVILRGLARSANWTGTPVRTASARWSIDRQRAADRLLLYVDLTVQYRDTE